MIAIIQYNAGNAQSVQNTLTKLGYSSTITQDKATVLNAEKVIFPGVGEASSAMRFLQENQLDKTILSITQPFLGICLGLQLMCKFSEEGNTQCLGIFDVNVQRFLPKLRVPHMGWNNLISSQGMLFNQIANKANFYFVHSYFASVGTETQGICNYIEPFSAVLQKNNFYGCQFHPEKSGEIGEQFLRNFLSL